MRSGVTSSSSAAIWRIAVRTPWPISTRPVDTVTWPGAGKLTQRSRRGLSASRGGSEGLVDALIARLRRAPDRSLPLAPPLTPPPLGAVGWGGGVGRRVGVGGNV